MDTDSRSGCDAFKQHSGIAYVHGTGKLKWCNAYVQPRRHKCKW
jgi:hypothetical protein